MMDENYSLVWRKNGDFSYHFWLFSGEPLNNLSLFCRPLAEA